MCDIIVFEQEVARVEKKNYDICFFLSLRLMDRVYLGKFNAGRIGLERDKRLSHRGHK